MLNLPLLVGTLVALAILSPAAYCWHSFQLSRTADSLLEEADRLEQQGEHAKAAAYIHRYLQLRPDDAKVRVRLAKTFDKSASDPSSKLRAINLYYRALGLSQDEIDDVTRRDLRCRLAELLLEVARYPSAEAEADKLLEANDKDPEAWRLLALALDGQLRSGALAARPGAGDREDAVSVIGALDRAIQLNPTEIQLALALARICRDEDQICIDEKKALGKAFSRVCPDGTQSAAEGELEQRRQLADKLVDQMVTANPKSPDAFLGRCRYRIQYELPGAEDDLKSALEHGPNHLGAVLAAAEWARQKGVDALRRQAAAARGADAEREAAAAEAGRLLDEAAKHYARAAEIAPRDPRVYLGLGYVRAAQAQTDQAIAAWRLGLKQIDRQQLSRNPNLLGIFADLNLRVAGALIDQGQLHEAWVPDADLDKAEERAKAEKTPLHQLEFAVKALAPRLSRPYRLSLDRTTSFVQARWFVRKRDYDNAIPLLKELTAGQPTGAEEAAQAYQAWGLLSGAYGAQGEWGNSARSWERAAALQPSLPGPRVAAAMAWRRAGQLDLAMQQYRLALAVNDHADIQFQMAQTQFAEQVALPEEQRDWALFKTALEKLKNPAVKGRLQKPWELDLLEAGYLLAQAPGGSPGDGDDSKRAQAILAVKSLLEATEAVYPDSSALFAALVMVYERLDLQEGADRALATLQKLPDGLPASYLLGSQVLRLRKQYAEARKLVREGIQKLPPASRVTLRNALVDIALAEGGNELAQKELLALHEADPSNVELLLRLADFAMRMRRFDDLRQWEEKLRKAEGPGGLNWRYCKARRLLEESLRARVDARKTGRRETIEKAATNAAKLVSDANTLCSEIWKQRPNWAPALELRGRVLQEQARLESTAEGRQLKYQQAVEAYQKVISLGADPIAVYEQMIPLLYSLERVEEADRYLARLKSRGGIPHNLLQYEISAAGRQGGLPEAIDAARLGVEARPGDPNAQLWYGRLLLADGQREAAEAALRKAVELAPTDADPYLALFEFHVGSRDRQRAEETLAELADHARLSPLQLAIVTARAYERLGDLQKVEEKYREAERLAKDNVSVKVAIKSRLAEIFLRSDLAEAERQLREILKLAPESDAARQGLARLLAHRAVASPDDQDPSGWQEIQALLQQSGAGGETSAGARLLQAVVYRAQGGKDHLEKARRILEKLVEDREGDLDLARFHLALVYAAQSEPYRADAERYQKLKADPEGQKKLAENAREYLRLTRKFREQFLAIVARNEPEPLYLESYIHLLLQHKDALPQSPDYSATPWLKKLETAVTQPRASTGLLNRYYALLRRHGLQAEAGQWLTRLDEVLPENLYVLALRARWLHHGDRASEIEATVEQLATKLLKAAEKDGETDREKESQLCLSIGNVYSSVEQHPAAERWYRRLAKLSPEHSSPLALSLARQDRLSEAIDVCLQAADSDGSPQAAMVLASVLLTGKPTDEHFKRAEPLLEKAAEDHKDHLGLLGSLANVRILEGRTDDAVQIYHQILKLEPNDVRTLNNLATLLAERADTRKEALKYVEQAIQIGGPQAPLLDTKGTALILEGKPREAIPCLEKAASAPQPDPRYHLHLAVAYQQVRDTEKAREAFEKARDGNLQGQILMPSDQKYLSELEQKLGQ